PSFGADKADSKADKHGSKTVEPVYRLSAVRLCAEHNINGQAAQKKYFGKTVEIKSLVSAVGHASVDFGLIPTHPCLFQCYFSDASEAAAFQIGEEIVIRGKCGAVLRWAEGRYITVFKCSLVKRGK